MTKRNSTGASASKQAKKKYTTERFIMRAKAIHGERYSYTKSLYTTSKQHLIVTCKKHGDFSVTPERHLRGVNCNKCSADEQALQNDEFIERAKRVHGDYYCYAKSDCKGAKRKVVITCKRHGDFLQRAEHHLSGRGCKICGKERQHPISRTTEQFIKEAKAVHGSAYDYSLSEYTGIKRKLDIICKAHGKFSQVAEWHLSGSGCPDCKSLNSGFGRSNFKMSCRKNDGMGFLYIIKCSKGKEVFYKVGVTSNSVGTRYKTKKSMPYSYTEAALIEGKSDFIFDLERSLHRLLSPYRHEPSIHFEGRTECFTTIKPVEKLLKQLQSTDQLQLIA